MNIAHKIQQIRSWWHKHDSISQYSGTQKTTLQRAIERELARLKKGKPSPNKQIAPPEKVQTAYFSTPLRSSIFQR